jgi:hypothetical protein
MIPAEFIEELKHVFYHKNKLMQFDKRQQDIMFDTIKAFLQKKQLIVVSRVEYERLLKFKEQQDLRDLADSDPRFWY